MKTTKTLFLAFILAAPCVRGEIIFTNLYSFTSVGTNGVIPRAGLVQDSDGNFYGTTSGRRMNGSGRRIQPTVFKITPDGALTTLAFLDETNNEILFRDLHQVRDAVVDAGLVQGNDGNFYGTTTLGGSMGYGTAFQITTNGMLTTLASFNGITGTYGWWLEGGLMQGKDDNFYGLAYQGGPWNLGTVFSITTNGVLTKLAAFNGTNGAYPRGKLVQDEDGNLYGTTTYGGAYKGISYPGNSGYGTVFRITTNGQFKTLVSFDSTNGCNPFAGLVRGHDGNFYGTTSTGGAFGSGTVFQLTTDDKLNTLASFAGSNGANPHSVLIQGKNGNFYGTTFNGGQFGKGTVFEITTNGKLIAIFSFNDTNGVNPEGELVQDKTGDFYGTTSFGGANGVGTVFRLTIIP